MPCPICSTDSLSDAARRREAEHARNAAARLTSEIISTAQAVRDISSRLRHKTGADPEVADMLDEIARRMAAEMTQTVSRMSVREP